MGGYFSTSAAPPSLPPPPPPPLLNEPWRKINWRDKQNDLQYLKNYKPQNEVQHLRILLHGRVGAGKSSFINSAKSVLQCRMCIKAQVENAAQGSCTKEYKTYKIQKGSSDTFYPVVLNDIMGLSYSNRRNQRIHVKDIKRVMKGHVKDGYTFNPESKLSKDDRFYNSTPTANDKVHVLVFVVDANKVSLMSKEDVQLIQDIRDDASDLGIPQVAILTHIDEVVPEINEDLKNVYRSSVLKKKMEHFSADVGIPMYCIFPVKNYHEEIDLNDDIDALILNTLKNIIDIGEESLNKTGG